ncbi:hypothetical protein GM676_06290 [Duganella radicis]|uniref:Abortive infection protein n=2 Tax=Duganella radicis TaxID=551988 RepID=A0A6L6PDR8_9BURK|nr:hypothetical protein [Duganella radicis]
MYKSGSGGPTYRGVVYDVGVRFAARQPLSVEPFDLELARYDLQTIGRKLHCNAVRIEGEDIGRLLVASRIAHAEGMTVFFNPWKMNVPVTDLSEYYRLAARAAEQLRAEGVELVFVCGCEITLFNEGLFPGSGIMERASWLSSFGGADKSKVDYTELLKRGTELNAVLRSIVTSVREEFGGKVSYASGAWEMVDWTLFDLVGVDHYRNGEPEKEYVAGLDRFRQNKPLVVMEVGCCAYEGAGPRGSTGFTILEGQNEDGSGRFAGGKIPARSEREQADYVDEQLRLLSQAGVDGVFIYVFSFPLYTHGSGAKDLDMVSYALVKTYPKDDPRSRQIPPWAPKESFARVAGFYKQFPRQVP